LSHWGRLALTYNKHLSQSKNTGGRILNLKYVDATKRRGAGLNRGTSVANKWQLKS
jgi:hypothetical protein